MAGVRLARHFDQREISAKVASDQDAIRRFVDLASHAGGAELCRGDRRRTETEG